MAEKPKPHQTETGTEVQGYRVLARKYRPQIFSDLIGQDAMVKTLENAFKTGRIAQAYMLTGVRGVGKTTTARLIARALNYTLSNGPTLDMPEMGEHCGAILESRHIDVIEMDAASNTGIDDVREIIEAVRYKPAQARYKVYIIDEVHMLSRQAFNGLLKTLEEPPEHVKFIFATTEIRKVPVTVLSRCQRFDLRRVDDDVLISHFQKIADAEGVKIDEGALRLIARASEGSVRDGLSLLDQAIAHGAADIDDKNIRDMLGLVDRAQVIDLFECVMKGDMAKVLEKFSTLYQAGGDPAIILADLAELVHLITRFKVAGEADDGVNLSQLEITRGRELAEKLDMRVLARAWQMLLKGLNEVSQAANTRMAADMVLIRMAHIADLPSPDEIIAKFENSGDHQQSAPKALSKPPLANAPPTQTDPSTDPVVQQKNQTQIEPVVETNPSPAPVPQAAIIESFNDVVDLLGQKRDLKLKSALEHAAHLIAFKKGHIELRLDNSVSGRLANELGRKLTQWTGDRWIVALSSEQGADTLAQQAAIARNTLLGEAREDPLVAAALKVFAGAEIVDVRDVFAENAPDNPDDEDDDL